MATGVDLKLFYNKDLDFYDLALSNGDFIATQSFDTSLLVTLFGEQRANESEIDDVSSRRGWWGNTLSTILEFEQGSKLWLLSQARLTQDNLNKTINYLQLAYNWLVSQGYAKKIEVTGTINNNGFDVLIKILVGRDYINTPSYSLWLNTGVSNINIQVF